MMTCGFFVELEAARDQETSVERFLDEALPLVRAEPATGAWFAVRFRRFHYGIFDVFPDAAAREAHRTGAVAQALAARSSLFAHAPVFHAVDVLDCKLPGTHTLAHDQKAVFVRMTPQHGREYDLEALVRSTRLIVDAEPDTTAWLGLKFENGDYGIFDAFPTSQARRKHLFGRAPRELIKHFRLLGKFPRLSMMDVRAEAFAG
jgi:quinol monooxygenase YgiN